MPAIGNSNSGGTTLNGAISDSAVVMVAQMNPHLGFSFAFGYLCEASPMEREVSRRTDGPGSGQVPMDGLASLVLNS